MYTDVYIKQTEKKNQFDNVDFRINFIMGIVVRWYLLYFTNSFRYVFTIELKLTE